MSRKKKEQRKDDKLQKIYDEEPATPVFFNEKRAEPRPFKGENGAWYCGRLSCMNDNAMLWRLSDGRCICGHCYHVYNI